MPQGGEQSAPSADLPLTGLRILDLSKVLAGPLCTQSLADMGAEVIKVEAVEGGDETRRWPPLRDGAGAVFLSVNRNKRSIAIDLKQEAGQKIVHELAKRCDVAVESFAAGVAERLRCDAATLTSLNPGLVYCKISGFGRDGPLSQAPGYDVILQAFTGVMAMTGDPDGGHVRSPISPIDQATGLHAVTGVLAALFARQRGRTPPLVEVSLFDTALGLLGYNLQTFWETASAPARNGSRHDSLCPYQAFEASDGPVMIGVANDGLWRRFCQVAELQGIVDEPRFCTNVDRVAHRDETVARVQEAVGKRPVAYWWTRLLEVGVPCSPINTIEQMLMHKHTAASGMVLESETASGDSLRGIAQPIRLAGVRSEVRRLPPTLGQHTQEVLEELGYAAAQISELRCQRVVS
jgi:formyl-CoA transferase